MAVIAPAQPTPSGSRSLRSQIGAVSLLWVSMGSIIGSGWPVGAKTALFPAGPAAIIS